MTALRIGFGPLRHPVPDRRGRALIVGLLVVILAAPAAARPAAWPIPPGEAGVDLYVSNPIDNPAGQRLTPIDPLTLADRTDAAVIRLGSMPSFWLNAEDQDRRNFWIPAADGSLLLGAEYAATDFDDEHQPEEVTFVVRDGRSGAERARFHPPGSVWASTWPRLSADGSLLAIEGYPDRQAASGGPLVWWYVMDTQDGELVGVVEAAEEDHWGYWLDPVGRRLYYLAWPGQRQLPTEPSQLRIVAHDLATGTEVGRLAVPDVPYGSWETAPGEWAAALPGVALSPDGRQFAVVHPDRSAVTLIEAAHLRVERTVGLERPASMRDRLLGLLPLVPREAAAKGADERTYVSAVYGPDGRHLYLSWDEYRAADTEQPRRTGLMVVDPGSGTILAETALDGDTWVSELVPAPDGRSVYVTTTWALGDGRLVLQRLDATRLEVLAERVFEGYRWFVVRGRAV